MALSPSHQPILVPRMGVLPLLLCQPLRLLWRWSQASSPLVPQRPPYSSWTMKPPTLKGPHPHHLLSHRPQMVGLLQRTLTAHQLWT